jgi:hypothetical protein
MRQSHVCVALLGAFEELWNVTISFVMSVRPLSRLSLCPHGTPRLPLDGFYRIRYCSTFFFLKIQVSIKYNKNNAYFICRPVNILIVSRSVLPKMKNVSDKSCRENRNTHFMSNNFENHAVFEVMWKQNVGQGRTQMTIWRMRNACWIPWATKTHSEYVILVFPLQQRASMLRCTMFLLLLLFSDCLRQWHCHRGWLDIESPIWPHFQPAWAPGIFSLPVGQSVKVSKLADRSYKQMK